jgi:enhancing lycopene biosynthesis protein 2
MKRIAVVIAGCGHRDGAEITETVSLLIALSEAGAKVSCFAPDIEFEEVNHLTGEKTGIKRNVKNEVARITRGKVETLENLNPNNFDGLCFSGGSGVAKNLCTWATQGANFSVLPHIEKIITDFHAESKPMGAICIAPVLLAKVLGKHNVTLTIGDNDSTIKEIEKTGARHEVCPADDYLSDRECKVVTTPAYMYDNATPNEVFKGIFGLAHELVEWA